MLSNGPNESFFSSSCEGVVTPDPLGMAFICPKVTVVAEHLRRCSEDQYFMCFAGNDNLCEGVRVNPFVDIYVPGMQREREVGIMDNDVKLLRYDTFVANVAACDFHVDVCWAIYCFVCNIHLIGSL